VDSDRVSGEFIEDMAARYLEELMAFQPEGPYYLGGWSFGGAVAFEMARQLAEREKEIALLLLIDTQLEQEDISTDDDLTLLVDFAFNLGLFSRGDLSPPPRLAEESLDAQLDYILGQGQRMGLLPPDFDLAQLCRLFEVFKANAKALSSYKARQFEGRITYFAASEPLPGTASNTYQRVDRFAAGGVEMYKLPGNHFTMMKEPHVKAMAGLLEQCLAIVPEPFSS
jgi:thioesterase domain-containing protein